jgi:hypothetical protein
MLFAKNKPTKTIYFDDAKENFVVLQHLSKGAKDNYTGQLAELSLSMKGVNKETFENMDIDKLPDGMGTLVKKINELEYEKVAAAIKKWSAAEDITVDSVKELDEDVFVEISKTVDEMNKLTELERKN